MYRMWMLKFFPRRHLTKRIKTYRIHHTLARHLSKGFVMDIKIINLKTYEITNVVYKVVDKMWNKKKWWIATFLFKYFVDPPRWKTWYEVEYNWALRSNFWRVKVYCVAWCMIIIGIIKRNLKYIICVWKWIVEWRRKTMKNVPVV